LQGLSGILPASIGRLPGLSGLKSLSLVTTGVYLKFQRARISGPLPPEWGSGPGLVGLEALEISLNYNGPDDQRGGLPPEWGTGPGLANLKTLDLSWWPGGSSVPCSWVNLTKLERLSFDLDGSSMYPKGCLPSPQLELWKILQLYIGEVWGDDAVPLYGTLSGVRGERAVKDGAGPAPCTHSRHDRFCTSAFFP
jgi:hypothetical protein